MADENPWETITDPSDVPSDIRKSLGVAGVRKALGIGTGGADAAPTGGGKLPAWAAGPYEKQISVYAGLKGALDGFRDDYGGNTVTGNLENTIQGVYSGFGSEGQRDWWAQFRSNDNVIRNQLFGAALTPGEQKAYEATTVTPSMDPKEIRRNLQSRAQIVQKALARKTKFLRAQGYSGDAIDALAGEYAPDFNPQLRQQTEGGGQASGVAGAAADGSGAPPSGPTTPTTPPPGTEVKFNDELPNKAPGADAYTAEVEAGVKNGTIATAADLAAVQRKYGYQPSDPAETEKFFQAIRGGAKFAGAAEPEIKPINLGDGALGAGLRGVADTATAGLLPRAGAALETIFDGGTYDQNLARNRGILLNDEQEHGVARAVGQIAGGVVIPSGAAGAARAAGVAAMRSGLGREAAIMAANRVFATRAAQEAAAYGGAYGFNSAEGGVGDRLAAGAAGAGVGALTGGAIAYGGGRAAAALNARARAGGQLSPAQAERSAFADAAERQGIDYMAADVPGRTGTRWASGLTRVTLGGIPLAEAAEKTIASARAARDRIAEGVGVVSDTTGAGQAVQRGARKFVASSEQRASRLYEAIPIDPNANAPLTQTRETLRRITQGFDSNKNLSKLWAENPRLRATLDAITTYESYGRKNPDMSWGDLKRFRSIVGQIAGSPSLTSDGAEVANMKALYGALSQDMEATARNAGPQAARAFERANSYWRGRENRIENTLSQVLGNDLDMSPDAAFRRIEAMSQARTGDAQGVARLIRSLPEDEANSVRATVLSRLGNAPAGRQDAEQGVFSPSDFMTHWNKLSDRAKSVLFQNEHRAAINDLVRVADGMKGASEFANTSKTSLATNALALAGVFWTNPLAALGAAGVQFGGGKLLGSPEFAKWLAKVPKKPNPSAQLAHVKRLSAVAKSSPAVAQDILALQERLASAFTAAPTRLAAQEPGNESSGVVGQNNQTGERQ